MSEDYIISQLRTYGSDSREFRVRVLGEFPESGQDSVIPRAFVEAALKRDIMEVSGDIVWGLDPGRGGDPTGFVERTANILTELRLLRYTDTMNVVGWVKQRFDNTPIRKRPIAIYVDSIGLGAGVADRLLELELPIVHVNVAETSSQSDRFTNLRGELAYALREWLESAEVAIAPSEMADAFVEQCSEVQQKFTSTGKVQLETKQEMKKRGVASPNLYDAAALTFADGAETRIGNYEHGWGSVNMANYRVPNISVRRK